MAKKTPSQRRHAAPSHGAPSHDPAAIALADSPRTKTGKRPKPAAKRLNFQILSQPDYTTCGPTCLAAIYGYHGDQADLTKISREIRQLNTGGTLGVFLANHAIRRGYSATIYTYNLQVFDPTWFGKGRALLREKLLDQLVERSDDKIRLASRAYVEFLELGGKLQLADLTPKLIRKFLNKGLPVLTGLSSTFLYRAMREIPPQQDDDDIRGEPSGHFVVVYGYDRVGKKVLVADPLLPNDYAGTEQYYEVDISRLVNSILLGIITHDANLVIIKPKPPKPEEPVAA
jgi:hypothetical protein